MAELLEQLRKLIWHDHEGNTVSKHCLSQQEVCSRQK